MTVAVSIKYYKEKQSKTSIIMVPNYGTILVQKMAIPFS